LPVLEFSDVLQWEGEGSCKAGHHRDGDWDIASRNMATRSFHVSLTNTHRKMYAQLKHLAITCMWNKLPQHGEEGVFRNYCKSSEGIFTKYPAHPQNTVK